LRYWKNRNRTQKRGNLGRRIYLKDGHRESEGRGLGWRTKGGIMNFDPSKELRSKSKVYQIASVRQKKKDGDWDSEGVGDNKA